MLPAPVGRGPAAPTLIITGGLPTTGANVETYDAAVHHAFAQVQAAVAASAELNAVPSNLDPPLPTRHIKKWQWCRKAACAIFSKSDSLNARQANPPR